MYRALILSRRMSTSISTTYKIKIGEPRSEKVKRLKIEEYPDELPLSKAMLEKLEQLSALKFESLEEIESVEEDIRLAQKIFEVDTTDIEPLYSIVENRINCPLREDDEIEETSASEALRNAPKVVEDFIVTPIPNILQEKNPLLEHIGCRREIIEDGKDC